ncbi:alpha/beta fold hydrolase [Actinocrispum wychmicini]|uniref:2-hydroxy-6-oxonona-2,4-dienedioate hydrolase/2-hydroxy-6-oxo-6-(2'-carboxyphenyl)-hexa-2, 4-dienoate hydrolase n=1 Tax=Actinocrispum wychmicini TaxID=1213861 RepID=A0A4R2JRS2_9PSEU|nr:alpha/beta hydrolase [Actinocrispum wychmicini]TCO59918.1 2-hydroxy-6-oxonona-2,4-dienedioate hydrolase/2-hydroxy-6-oxo-6-(2'-carboxyphenyl)-hexa-2,4-dienoate hydrolase [Actinocrispum wychmicini]
MGTIWADLLGTQVRHLGSRYTTRVIEAGTGEPLVLLHGVGGHAEAYSRNVVRLGERYRAMAIDLVWHGMSGKPPFTGDAVGTYVEQILDLLDSEGIERAHLEGESLGGWVALTLALQHPDRVGKLVLNTTAGIQWNPGSVAEKPAEGRELLRSRSLAAIDDPSPETVRRRLEWLMASPDRVTDELVDVRRRIYADPPTNRSLRTVFENSFGFGSGPARRIREERLADVRVPTLVLWATHNPGSGPDVGRRIAELIPGARFHCVDDAAHWPQWEKPDEHDRVVLDFLASED